MSWKNLTLKWKFGIAFGVVLLFLAGVAGGAIYGIHHIVTDAGEVIAGNALRETFAEKKVDHLHWATQVNALLTDESVNELTAETDPHKCSFGEWYYSEDRAEAERLVPELKEMLVRIEAPHRQLHESAIAIRDAFRPTDPKLPLSLAEMKVGHLEWRSNIVDAMAHRRDELGVVMDPTQCALGKWVSSEDGQRAYERGDAEFKAAWDQLLESHAALHASAKEIQDHLAFVAEAEARTAQAKAHAELGVIADTLFATLERVMEEAIDPAKERAAEAKDIEALTKWSAIDMVMNEELIEPFLVARIAFESLQRAPSADALGACDEAVKVVLAGAEQWIAMLGGTSAEPTGEEVKKLLEQWKPAAERLSQAIQSGEAAVNSVREARRILDETAAPLFDQTLARLDALREEAEHEMEGVRHASEIYATQTLPALQQVEDLFQELDRISHASVLTDEAMLAAASTTRAVLIGAGAVAVVLGIVLACVMVLGLTRPILRSVRFAQAVAEGDLTQQVDIDQADEIGVLAKSLNGMASNLRKTVQGIAENAHTLADSSTELSATAIQLANGAEETTTRSMMVATAAEEMATNMNNMAASSEEMSANVKTVASAVE
ncbi:MAG: CZB domain-containing protein, partial [Phycisphaerae bacterium]|nr:CZB domain-containing protein [Phycisphaerae bacterium]